MPSNSKEYMNEYMKQYIAKKSEIIVCPVCDTEYKKYNKYAHNKTKKHLLVEKKIEDTKLQRINQ